MLRAASVIAADGNASGRRRTLEAEGKDQAADATPQDGDESATAVNVENVGPDESSVQVPEFAPLQPSDQQGGGVGMDRFYGVNVDVWAELGRSNIPLGELMQLGEGAVLKLNRSISEPVDLVAQGVRVARGEVVVVDDSFAIRIKELEPPKNN